MAFSDALGGIYSKAEGIFFGAMDFLEQKGLPVYNAINPLESRGIPVFPVTIAIIVLLSVFAYGFFVSAPDVVVSFDLRDNHENELLGVGIEIRDMSGSIIELEDSTINNGENILLKGMPIGSRLSVSASKDGYREAQGALIIEGQATEFALQLQKDSLSITGRIELVDNDTGDLIRNAEVTAQLSDGSTVTCYPDAEGTVLCPGVIDGERVVLTITSGNYEQDTHSTTFNDGSTGQISLAPRPEAMSGNSNLIVRAIDTTTLELLGNVTIKIYDATADELISEVIDSDGDYTEQIAKGTSVRIVVEKEGYVSYDSGAEGLIRTMRNEEEPWKAFLEVGGKSILIGAIDGTGALLPNALIMLFNENSDLIESEKTGFAGTVEFDGLEPTAKYYVTAYLDRYIPSRIELTPSQQQTINIELEREISTNSAKLEVTVARADDSTIANDATINFFEVIGEENLPLGLPQAKTGLNGTYSTNAPQGKEVLVKAVKGHEEGEGSALIEEGNNEIIIYIDKPVGVVLFKLIDETGNAVTEGNAAIENGSGDTIFDGEVADGEIFVNAGDDHYLKLVYTAPDGREFSEEVAIGDEFEVEVRVVLGDVPGFAPGIEFRGIYDLAGDEVQGISLGEDYYAKFEVTFPEGTGGGVHVRVGRDSERYVDSQDVGITGFTAIGADHFYGRTYSATPEPGYEGIDFQNQGMPGEYNKWLELYFDRGGTKIVKVRVKAKETALANNFEIHYRAWTVVGASYYRTPGDNILLLEEYNEQRSGLYAEAEVNTIKLFEGKAKCENELCAGFKFVRADGSEYGVENFQAIKNERYALQIELNPSKDILATLKASTSHTAPKLYFTGYGINNYSEFPDNNKTDTSIEVGNVSAAGDNAVIARLYFRTSELENAAITLQLITEDTVISETFYFNIYYEKSLKAVTEPSTVSLGEDFTVFVENEDNDVVGNATVKLKDSRGRVLETIFGDNSRGNGLNGRYDFDNTFDAGTITIDITAEGHKPHSFGILVSKTGVLKLPESVDVIIPSGGKTSDTKVKIVNNKDEAVQNISFKVIKKGSWPSEMELSIDSVGYVDKKGSMTAMFTGTYTGDAEREHAEAEVIVRGEILGKYPVTAATSVTVEYNPELIDCTDNGENVECLEFSKEKIIVYVLGNTRDYDSDYRYGNNYYNNYKNDDYYDDDYYPYSSRYRQTGSTKDISFTIKNNSQLDLTLTPEVVARGTEEEDIKIDVSEVRLMPKGTDSGGLTEDSKEVTIYVSNELVRNYPGKKTFKYDVFFRSDSVTKSIPLEVVIWDKRYALHVMRNIELWLAENAEGTGAWARVPLYVMNSGEADIENLRFTIGSGMQRGNIDLQLEPAIALQTLKKGQSLTPPIMVIAKALRTAKATLHDVSQIVVKGTIDGKEIDFGPIYVTAHISPPQCLLAIPGDLSFHSARATEGAISKPVTIRNNCAEAVRVRGIETSSIGGNQLTISPSDVQILPGSEAKVQAILTKRQPWTGPVQPAFIKAWLLNSNQWTNSQPINLDIKLGKTAVESKEATTVIDLQVCDSKEKEQVILPKIALTANCDKAYCDAEQLAAFLVQKIESKVKGAKRQVQNYNAETIGTNCESIGSTYCDFDRLGVKSEEFEIYFMNDNLSTEMIENTISKKSSELSAYSVSFTGAGTSAGSLLGPYGNQIFLNDVIQGCGRYTARITGAVRVQGTKLLSDYVNVVIDLHQVEDREELESEGEEAKKLTGQCTGNIQNVMNFLPIDKEYTPSQRLESWLAILKTDNKELKKNGKDYAKTLFDSKDRFPETDYGTSKLELKLGAEEGYIVKLTMTGASTGNPGTVVASIMESAGDQQKAIVEEAIKAIRGLRENVIDGCISPSRDYLLIKSAKDIGKIEIELTEASDTGSGGKLTIMNKQKACLEFKVLGDIKETVVLKAELVEEAQGTEKPVIEIGGKLGKELKIFEKDKDKKKNKYSAKASVCIEGLKDFALAQDKKIRIIAESKTNSQKKDEKEVVMQACGIHPYEFLKKVSELEPAEGKPKIVYATLAWKGEKPEFITLSQLKTLEVAIDNETTAAGYLKNKELKISDKELTKNERIIKGMTRYYLPACAVVSAVCNGGNPFTGGFIMGWLLGPALDCGLPALFATSDGLGSGSTGKFFSDSWNSVKGVLGDYAPEWLTSTGESVAESETLQKLRNSQYRELMIGAGIGVSTHSTTQGYVGSFGLLKSSSEARSVASTMSGRITDNIMDKYFKSGASGAYRSNIKKTIEDSIFDRLNADIGGATPQKIDPAYIEKVSREAIANAESKVSDDLVNAFSKNPKDLKDSYRGTFDKWVTEQKAGQGGFFMKETDEAAKAAGKLDLSEFVNSKGKLRGAWKKKISTTADQLSEDVLGKLEIRSGKTIQAGQRAKIKKSITKEIESRLFSGTKNNTKSQILKPGEPAVIISKDAFIDETTIRKAVSSGVQKNADELTDALIDTKPIKNAVGKAMKEWGDDGLSKASKGLKWKKLKQSFKNVFSKEFAKGLGKGLFCGAASNAAGLFAYNYYWDNHAEADPVKTPGGLMMLSSDASEAKEVLCDGKDNDGDGQIDEGCTQWAEGDDTKLLKYNTYKVRKVLEEKNTQLYLTKATKIPEKAEFIEDCTGASMNKKAGKLLPGLLPEAGDFKAKWGDERGLLEASAIVEYYNKIGTLTASIAKNQKIPEALLITIALMYRQNKQTGGFAAEYITGCGAPDRKKDDDSFKCAARELEKAINSSAVIDDWDAENVDITQILKAYVKANEIPGVDVPEEKYQMNNERYNLWNKNKFAD